MPPPRTRLGRRSALLTCEDTRAGQRARYRLTEAAIQLVPVFAQLGSWGLRHRPTSRALRVRAEPLEQGGPALCASTEAEERGLADVLGLEFEPAPDDLAAVLTYCDMTTSPDGDHVSPH